MACICSHLPRQAGLDVVDVRRSLAALRLDAPQNDLVARIFALEVVDGQLERLTQLVQGRRGADYCLVPLAIRTDIADGLHDEAEGLEYIEHLRQQRVDGWGARAVVLFEHALGPGAAKAVVDLADGRDHGLAQDRAGCRLELQLSRSLPATALGPIGGRFLTLAFLIHLDLA
jgi:hypothetical protein